MSSYCPVCGANTEQIRTEQERTVTFRCRGCRRAVTVTVPAKVEEVA